MVTYIYTAKVASPDEINKNLLRIMPSKDGEMTTYKNQLIVTDWTTNVHRIQKILAEIDVPKK